MPIEFSAPYPEPGQQIGFGQNTISSDAEYRDETSLPAALGDSKARFHLFAATRALIRKGENPTAIFRRGEIEQFQPALDTAILLGHDATGPRLAVQISASEDDIGEPFRLYDMRALLYSSSVTDEEASGAAQAASLLHWHSMNRFCGKCGDRSQMRLGGFRRDCASCGLKIFPRTDPVVIMLAIRGSFCLLGRSPHFPAGWYSTLAGFVEPGETIEAAVRRETLEESGIRIGRVQYHASQPWPFPHSLMIGAYGEAESSDIDFDAQELEDCQWFSREEVVKMIRDEDPRGYKCPPSKAISHSLIARWATA